MLAVEEQNAAGGVKGRKIDVIKYDDQKLSEAKLREVINSTGFKAVEQPGQ